MQHWFTYCTTLADTTSVLTLGSKRTLHRDPDSPGKKRPSGLAHHDRVHPRTVAVPRCTRWSLLVAGQGGEVDDHVIKVPIGEGRVAANRQRAKH